MYYYYYYYSFSSSSPSPYVAQQCYQYLAYGAYPTYLCRWNSAKCDTTGGPFESKRFPTTTLTHTLSSSCCLFLAKVQEAHIHKLCRPLLPHPCLIASWCQSPPPHHISSCMPISNPMEMIAFA